MGFIRVLFALEKNGKSYTFSNVAQFAKVQNLSEKVAAGIRRLVRCESGIRRLVRCECESAGGFINPNNTFKPQRIRRRYVVEKDGKRYEFSQLVQFAKAHGISDHTLRRALKDKPNTSGFKLISKDFI